MRRGTDMRYSNGLRKPVRTALLRPKMRPHARKPKTWPMPRTKKKTPAKRKKKEKSISQLIKTADTLFSIKVRNLGSQDTKYGLMNRCYTCGNAFEVKRLHAGHYVSRMFKAARWDKDNARPQCFACNIYRKGDAAKFRQNLVKEIGEERVKAVEALRDASLKLNRETLLNIIYHLEN